jgi:hypothetical protein
VEAGGRRGAMREASSGEVPGEWHSTAAQPWGQLAKPGFSGLERATATTLSQPPICWMLAENSARYESWRCCLADHGSDTLWSA